MAKGDFIRLKSISLNYDFSSDWISKSRFFKTASVRFTVKDPWLIYSDKALNGRDPEFYNTGGVGHAYHHAVHAVAEPRLLIQ